MKIKIFPAGMRLTPVYDKCPRCGLDLSKHFVNSGDYQKYANENKAHAEGIIGAGISSSEERGTEGGGWNVARLIRVVNPFSNPYEKTSDGDHRGRSGWKFWQKTGASENKDKNANGHESFVPAVKHKLGKRIFHWLFGSGGNR